MPGAAESGAYKYRINTVSRKWNLR